MRTAAGPGVGRAGLRVRPVALGVALADDEKRIVLEIVVAARREGELGVLAVGLADLPEGRRRLGGEGNGGRNEHDEQSHRTHG
ncbi:MAG: hypothetical protein NT049_15690 [Planctomycetota bacterium]|nr:hypothetical protein [Planctomycetota bacterium]